MRQGRTPPASGEGPRVAAETVDVAPLSLPSTGPITIALTGDTLILAPVEDAEGGSPSPFDITRRAHAAFTNLELTLRPGVLPPEERAGGAPRWPYGTSREARELRRLGFDLISRANNHAFDYQGAGIDATAHALDAAGLVHAGAGKSLDEARQPAIAGGSRKIALLAVTTSSAPESRATYARTDITARPGVNPLRYAADVTADAATFRTLRESAAQIDPASAGTGASDDVLTLFGTTIRRGERTEVNFIVAGNEEKALLDQVRHAREQAAVVVVSLHSHEPTNASETPAAFVERFARAAIDAGAHLVVGHGPHRLRGIELYEGGVIFYSLGNFLYQAATLDFRAADMFDAGTDLYGFMAGAERPATPAAQVPEEASWWESAIAEVSIDAGRLTAVRLHPLVLDRPAGTPRMAPTDRASEILNGLSRMSMPYKTSIQIEGALGVIPLPNRP